MSRFSKWTDKTVRLIISEEHNCLQLSIGDGESGYRLMGPKFLGKSRILRECGIDSHDAREIIRWCEQVIGSTSHSPEIKIPEITQQVDETKQELLQKIQQLETNCAAMRLMLKEVETLVYESNGVDGWLLNDGIVTWEDLGIDRKIEFALSDIAGQLLQKRVSQLEIIAKDAEHARDMIRYLQGSGWDNLECRMEVAEAAGDIDTSLTMLKEIIDRQALPPLTPPITSDLVVQDTFHEDVTVIPRVAVKQREPR